MLDEWTDELTAEYRRELRVRESNGSCTGAQSVDAVFERAKAGKGHLPTAFIFAVYAGACSFLASKGRRPAKRKHDGRRAFRGLELDPRRIYVGFEGQVAIDWTGPRDEAPRTNSDRCRSYRSPEERRGLPTDERSDLFSLTLSMAELFVLKRLSNGNASIEDSEGWADFAELVRAGARLPRELGSLFLNALAENSDERPAGIKTVLDDLARIGRQNGLKAHRAAIASHMHCLFADPPPPAALPSQTAGIADPSHAQDVRGSLHVFASLFPKPASTRTPQLLPPPPANEHRPSISSISVVPRPAPLPTFARASANGDLTLSSRGRESEMPPALARSIPPPQPPPIGSQGTRPLSNLSILPGSRTAKVTFGAAALAAAMAMPFLRSRPGKIVAVAAGHNGELLSDVEMHVDAEHHCTAARCTFEIAAGVHEVTVRADGYLPQLQLIAIGSGQAAAINFRLEHGGSSLDVSGRPEGASLVVDGRWIGRVPLRIDLAPGIHRVRVEAERFLPDERLVEMRLGETKKMADIALLPHMGWVTIDLRTPEAKASLVSGTERIEHLESSQPVELDLSRQWTLLATKDGYQPFREPLVWNDGSHKTVVITLERTTPTARR